MKLNGASMEGAAGLPAVIPFRWRKTPSVFDWGRLWGGGNYYNDSCRLAYCDRADDALLLKYVDIDR